MRPSPYVCASCLRSLRRRQSPLPSTAALIQTSETEQPQVNQLTHPNTHRYERRKRGNLSPTFTSNAVEHPPSEDLPPPAFDMPAISSYLSKQTHQTHQFHPVYDDAIPPSSPPPKKLKSKSPPQEPPPPTTLSLPLLPTTTPLSHHPSPLTSPPTASQLTHTQAFFHNSTKHLLFSVPDFYLTPISSLHPEVAFLGRSNVGKSTLLNAVMGVNSLARMSAKPGKTRLLNGYWVGGEREGAGKGIRGLGSGTTNKIGSGRAEGNGMGEEKGGLVILDMPGYGHGSRAEWGQEIVKYLRGRKQLRRVFLLIDPLHGPLEIDIQTLSLLSTHCIPTQIVLSKVDRVIARSLLSLAAPSLTTPSPPPALDDKRMALQSAFREVAEGIMTRIRQKAAAADGRGRLVGLADEVVGVGLGDSNAKAKRNKGSRTVGVMGLRWAILRACGLDGG